MRTGVSLGYCGTHVVGVLLFQSLELHQLQGRYGDGNPRHALALILLQWKLPRITFGPSETITPLE